MTQPFWVTAFLDFTQDAFEPGVRFWQDVTGYGLSPTRGDHDEFATLVPPEGDDYLRVQRLDEGENRIHLDVHVADPRTETERVLRLGAELVEHFGGHVVLRSPGGLTFCLVKHPAQHRPVPAGWPGGHTSLVDQVCLDIPPAAYDDECSFWQQLTGWELGISQVRPEFANLRRPPGVPIRLLLQRLDAADGPVSAHLDLSTTDRAAETSRHLALGATRDRVFEFWTVLSDPTGSTYCLTDRLPDTGMLP